MLYQHFYHTKIKTFWSHNKFSIQIMKIIISILMAKRVRVNRMKYRLFRKSLQEVMSDRFVLFLFYFFLEWVAVLLEKLSQNKLN